MLKHLQQLLAIMILMIAYLVSNARAEQPADIAATRAVANGHYAYPAQLAIDAPENTHNFSVTAHGLCRFIDVGALGNNQHLLVPFRNDQAKPEWQMFVQNVDPAQARLDLCRPAFNLSLLDGGTRINFGRALSVNDPAVAANERATQLEPAETAYPVAPAPIRRVHTADAAQFAAFRATPELRPSPVFSLRRQDCRQIAYPDGTVGEVCQPQAWTEQVVATFTYTIDKYGITPALDNEAARLRLQPLTRDPAADNIGAGQIGAWSMSLARVGNPPPFNPPTVRDCGPNIRNGDYFWQDVDTGSESGTCAGNTISDPRDPYTWHFIIQQEYQCFDGRIMNGAYPRAATRQRPGAGHHTGRCITPESGTCNPGVNGRNFYSLTNPAALCSSGTTIGFTPVHQGWIWGCQGEAGGVSVAPGGCYARQAIDAIVGPANGLTLPSAPGAAGDLCRIGTPSAVVGIGTRQAPWIWTCAGINGGHSVNGSATARIVPVDARCGTSAGGTFPHQPNNNLCDPGTVGAFANTTNVFAWTCQGLYGGRGAACTAIRRR